MARKQEIYPKFRLLPLPHVRFCFFYYRTQFERTALDMKYLQVGRAYDISNTGRVLTNTYINTFIRTKIFHFILPKILGVLRDS